MRMLDLNFDACSPITADAARLLSHHLPKGLTTLILRLNGHGDPFVQKLAALTIRIACPLQTLGTLDLTRNKIGARRLH